MASFLVSSLAFLAVSVPAVCRATPSDSGDGHKDRTRAPRVLLVEGAVELTPIEAMRSAEGAARTALMARFGRAWRARRAFWVPEARVESQLSNWLTAEVAQGRGLTAAPVEALETAVGTGYRQTYQIALDSREVRRIHQSGLWRVKALNQHFGLRWASMGGLWVLLVLAGFGIDRATRGWLTGRIAFVALSLGAIGTWVLLP